MTNQDLSNATLEAIRTTRSMRRVEPTDIPGETLKAILDAAIRAPSGSNQQTWSFIVVKDPDIKRALQEIYASVAYQYFEAAPKTVSDGSGAEVMTRVRSSARYLADNLHLAPVLIVACISGTRNFTLGASIYPAVQNMMVAARALGVGSTLTTFHISREDDVKQLLNIPADVHTAALIPLGYPTGKWGKARRRPVEEVVYLDEFGAALWASGENA